MSERSAWELTQRLGDLLPIEGPAALPGARGYRASAVGDGLAWAVPAGSLSSGDEVGCDLLLEGTHLAVFQLTLQAGAGGPAFHLTFSLLNQCQARLRLALTHLDQNRWSLGREGACLKRMCGGDRLDPASIDRATLQVIRKSAEPVCFCLTPLGGGPAQPPLTSPLLPAGPLLDELGQSRLHTWTGRTRNAAALAERLQAQAAAAPAQAWPASWSRWGGWSAQQREATGWFRREHDGQRWWLVDPAGHPFWSTGLDCVEVRTEAKFDLLEAALSELPDDDGSGLIRYGDAARGGQAVNYLAANFRRVFGDGWLVQWEQLALAELRRTGFNTVANWSRWETAAAAGFPYVRPLHFAPTRTQLVFRDFPDVFHPGFLADAGEFAEQLHPTLTDQALIGYFLMNEPTWGFAKQTPAEGMLLNYPAGPARVAFAEFLRRRYPDDTALRAAWGPTASFEQAAGGAWPGPYGPAASADLADFSSHLVKRYFDRLSAACRQVDPHHLNLGVRYYTVPPGWALAGMRTFDVFSLNSYTDQVPADRLAPLAERLEMPVLIGEWHFGALDAGLPATGIGHVADQAARGQAYRVYLEDAAAQPWCVGAHWFTLYDQSALGRFDGENYNIGFVDVCHQPYEPLAAAARAAHEVLYAVAAGEQPPYDQRPEYRPRLF
ncbi:MAG: hypothetical protein IT204_04830 [Fimbriimonadaceae bacterium]|nr:hypothetical protein [Fimbriimonadaceae bacterium]